MPATLEAVYLFIEAGILYAPGKASMLRRGCRGLEISQNSMRLLWTDGEVDAGLHSIMQNIHHACVSYGEDNGRINLLCEVNIAGFVKGCRCRPMGVVEAHAATLPEQHTTSRPLCRLFLFLCFIQKKSSTNLFRRIGSLPFVLDDLN